MATFNFITVDDKSFKFIGYGEEQMLSKGYNFSVQGDCLKVYNFNQESDKIIPLTKYDEISVDGVTFGSVLDLQLALYPLVFGGGGGGTAIDLTTVESTLASILLDTGSIDTDTTSLDAEISNLITEIQTGNATTQSILTAINGSILTELQQIDANTDEVETKLDSVVSNIVNLTSEVDQVEELLTDIKANTTPATSPIVSITSLEATVDGTITAGKKVVSFVFRGSGGTLNGSPRPNNYSKEFFYPNGESLPAITYTVPTGGQQRILIEITE